MIALPPRPGMQATQSQAPWEQCKYRTAMQWPRTHKQPAGGGSRYAKRTIYPCVTLSLEKQDWYAWEKIGGIQLQQYLWPIHLLVEGKH